MKKKLKVSANRIISFNYTKKQLENEFMSRLLKISAGDLSSYYSRRLKFLSGKSINYCKTGKLKFKVHPVVNELKLPDSAFRLGIEFGINIGIDVFNSIMDEADTSAKMKDETKNIKKDLLQKLRQINQ